jgi:hypothetical protein
MLVFDVIQNIYTIRIRFFKDGIEPHFVMIKFPCINRKVLHDYE